MKVLEAKGSTHKRIYLASRQTFVVELFAELTFWF